MADGNARVVTLDRVDPRQGGRLGGQPRLERLDCRDRARQPNQHALAVI
jgi:hypothetical protein